MYAIIIIYLDAWSHVNELLSGIHKSKEFLRPSHLHVIPRMGTGFILMIHFLQAIEMLVTLSQCSQTFEEEI